MKSSLSDGIVVFQLPSIDLQRLSQRGDAIQDWPEEAGQLLDGSIPPWMQLLLMGEEDAPNYFEKLPPNGKLSDLNLDEIEQRKAVVALAKASKRLLSQLASRGQQVLQQRLAASVDSKNQGLVEQLSRGVPPDLFRQAYLDWFGQESRSNLVRNELRVSTKSNDRSLRDHPEIKNKGDRQANGDDLLIDSSELSKATSFEKEAPAKSQENLLDESLLTEAPLATDTLSANSNAASTDDTDTSTWKPLKAIKHLEAGGWMIDRQRMAIVYIPTGHADPWLTATLTFASQLRTGDSEASSETTTNQDTRSEAIANLMLTKDGAGRCLGCHQSLDSPDMRVEQPEKLVAIHSERNHAFNQLWRADRFDARIRHLTRFDHGPHLLQSSLTDCAACHRMVATDATATSIPHRDFESMAVKDCANCHQAKAAGDNCTQCHNYHTNSIDP